jgi:hypothetical protein
MRCMLHELLDGQRLFHARIRSTRKWFLLCLAVQEWAFSSFLPRDPFNDVNTFAGC